MRRCKKITNIEDNYQQLILKKNVTLNIDDPVDVSEDECIRI